MDAQRVDMFLMTNGKYFQGHHLNYIRERLLMADESKWMMMQTLDLKDPTMMLVLSIIVGHLGVDRFLVGDIGLGVAKLLTCGGLGVWTVVDWFLIMDLTRQKNMEKLQQLL